MCIDHQHRCTRQPVVAITLEHSSPQCSPSLALSWQAGEQDLLAYQFTLTLKVQSLNYNPDLWPLHPVQPFKTAPRHAIASLCVLATKKVFFPYSCHMLSLRTERVLSIKLCLLAGRSFTSTENKRRQQKHSALSNSLSLL